MKLKSNRDIYTIIILITPKQSHINWNQLNSGRVEPHEKTWISTELLTFIERRNKRVFKESADRAEERRKSIRNWSKSLILKIKLVFLSGEGKKNPFIDSDSYSTWYDFVDVFDSATEREKREKSRKCYCCSCVYWKLKVLKWSEREKPSEKHERETTIRLSAFAVGKIENRNRKSVFTPSRS